MDRMLEAQFQRVETALNTLIDSISSYNPSQQAAVALIEADDELSKGLEQLTTHQENYRRLTSLKQTTSALSDQITHTLTLLSNTRQEVLATPATVFPAGSRDVPYNELLSYAKRISKFTVPPTRRPAVPQPAPREPPKTVSPPGEAETQTNGDATANSNANADSSTGSGPGPGSGPGIGVAALAPHESQWVNPAAPPWFIPWPSDETIRRGGLAQIQARVDAGLDPAVAPPEPSIVEQEREREEQARREKDEEAEEDEAQRTRDAETERRRAARGQNAMDTRADERARQERGREPEQPAVFGGLDLYDPDDD